MSVAAHYVLDCSRGVVHIGGCLMCCSIRLFPVRVLFDIWRNEGNGCDHSEFGTFGTFGMFTCDHVPCAVCRGETGKRRVLHLMLDSRPFPRNHQKGRFGYTFRAGTHMHTFLFMTWSYMDGQTSSPLSYNLHLFQPLPGQCLSRRCQSIVAVHPFDSRRCHAHQGLY